MAESKKGIAELTESQRRKNELIAELARARSGVSLHVGNARYQGEFGRRLKGSFRESFGRHVVPWLTGALLTGGLVSLLPARRKTVYVNPLSKVGRGKVSVSASVDAKPSGGFFMTLIRALTPLLKPLLTAFITKQLANVVGGAKDAQESAEKTTEAVTQSA